MAVEIYDGTPIPILASGTLRYVAVDSAGNYVEGSAEYIITLALAVNNLISSSTVGNIVLQPSLYVQGLVSASSISAVTLFQDRIFDVSSGIMQSSISGIVLGLNGGQLFTDSLNSVSSLSEITIGEDQFFQIDNALSISSINNIEIITTGGTFDIASMVSATVLHDFDLILSTVDLVHLGSGSGGLVKDIYGNTRVIKIFYSNNWIIPT